MGIHGMYRPGYEDSPLYLFETKVDDTLACMRRPVFCTMFPTNGKQRMRV